MKCQECSASIEYTPWDAPDSIHHCGPGVHFVTTPGHGGFVVDQWQNNLIPRELKLASFNGQGCRGFYEEDCDWAIPVAYLPQWFKSQQVIEAREFVNKYHLSEASS